MLQKWKKFPEWKSATFFKKFFFGYMESNIAASIQIKINLMRFEFLFIVYNIILLFTFYIFGYTFH